MKHLRVGLLSAIATSGLLVLSSLNLQAAPTSVRAQSEGLSLATRGKRYVAQLPSSDINSQAFPQPQTVLPGQGIEFVAPAAAPLSTPTAAFSTNAIRHLVVVDSLSIATLNQVKSVDPLAFRTFIDGGEVIQAGAFDFEANAINRLNELSFNGIPARIVRVNRGSSSISSNDFFASQAPNDGGFGVDPFLTNPAVGAPGFDTGLPNAGLPNTGIPSGNLPNTGFPPGTIAPPPFSTGQQTGTDPNLISTNQPPFIPQTDQFNDRLIPNVGELKGFYVVVPTFSVDETYSTFEQTLFLVGGSAGVQARSKPRGLHVAVGPFINRELTEQWTAYLRSQGLKNARVFRR